MYLLQWKNPALPGKTDITVPVASIVTNAAPITFTGKGAANYGKLQQQNFMLLLENFADTVEPLYPTIGQQWFDTSSSTLKVCSAVAPTIIWKSLGGIQVTNIGGVAPSPVSLGDLWFERTGSASGVLYIYTGLGSKPNTTTTIGGWNQIWPTIEMAAGREEFDYVFTLIKSLIGEPSVGGNGALGRYITNVPDLTQLDLDLVDKWSNVFTPQDANILTGSGGTSELLVDPSSNDWDFLLASAKYAVGRLDLPASYASDISPVPFVADGKQAPGQLLALANTNPMYPTLERRSNRRFGMVTMMRLYTETVNVLQAAITNRYSLKGINGASGTNAAFDSAVATVTHAQFTGAMGGSTAGSIGLGFLFPSADSLKRFIFSGGAIQVTLTHNVGGSPTSADTNFKTLLDTRGVFRMTADKVRTFTNTFPLVLAVAPGTIGLKDVTSATTVATNTVGSATYNIVASSTLPGRFDINISYNGGGAMNGTLTVKFEVIRDATTYTAPAVTPLYPGPTGYTSGNMTSTGPVMTLIP